MKEIVDVIVQNGLGVASFIALIYFMSTSLKDIKDTTEKISDTLILIQNNLVNLENRVTQIEINNKIERKNEKEEIL